MRRSNRTINHGMPDQRTDRAGYDAEKLRRQQAGTWLSPAMGAFVAVNKATGQLYRTIEDTGA